MVRSVGGRGGTFFVCRRPRWLVFTSTRIFNVFVRSEEESCSGERGKEEATGEYTAVL